MKKLIYNLIADHYIANTICLMMADCYDVVLPIMKFISNFNTLFAASQVCRLWRDVANEVIPKLPFDDDIYFKITKIRFLLEKDNSEFAFRENYPLFAKMCHKFSGKYPNFKVSIFDRWWKNSVTLPLVPVSEDDKYIIYESNDVPPTWKLKTLKWKVFCPVFTSNKSVDYVPVKENTQIVPDDLCWQWFQTGNKYKNDDEQVVIGSAGGWTAFHCCCAIRLLPGEV